MNIRISKQTAILSIITLTLVLGTGLLAPDSAQARVFLDDGYGTSEGDPGDGDDSMGGGGGSNSGDGSPLVLPGPKVPGINIGLPFFIHSFDQETPFVFYSLGFDLPGEDYLKLIGTLYGGVIK